jgi:hypothetical protein
VDQPFCLTVSFVNPHDREFFPFGTEFKTFNDLFNNPSKNPNDLKPSPTYPGDGLSGPNVPWGANKLKSPPPNLGYPDLPPNWETEQDWTNQMKPTTKIHQRFSEPGLGRRLRRSASAQLHDH